MRVKGFNLGNMDMIERVLLPTNNTHIPYSLSPCITNGLPVSNGPVNQDSSMAGTTRAGPRPWTDWGEGRKAGRKRAARREEGEHEKERAGVMGKNGGGGESRGRPFGMGGRSGGWKLTAEI